MVVGERTMTLEERRLKQYEQLAYEFLNPEQAKKKPNKSSASLCKRAKFLKNPRKAKQPGEVPL
jgi:hypothetical protein